MWRPVSEEVLAGHFRRDGAIADVGALIAAKPLRVTGGGNDPVEINLCLAGNQIADTVRPDAHLIDFVEYTRAVGHERLPRLLPRRDRHNAIRLPGASVGLPRHIGQRKITVFRPDLDLVDRAIIFVALFRRKEAIGIQVSVGGRVKVCGVGFERMRAELLDIDRDRHRQLLRPQDIEARDLALDIGQRR